ncbi:MAG: EamA family transporter RarD [Clostridia bacterium]|nr:EamA family transporter RarD [Clostridia bacterium]
MYRHSEAKSRIYVILCYILWGLLPIFWKLLSQLNPIYVLCSRIVWSLIFCFIILYLKSELNDVKNIFFNKMLLLKLFLSGILLSINWGSYIWAVNSNHVLDASLAYFINPIITVILGFIIYKEKLTAAQRISVIVAFIGILIPIVHEKTLPYLALIIGGSFSLYSALKKNIKLNSEISNFMETLAVTPIALFIIIYFEFQGIGSIGILRGWQFILLPLSGIVTSIPLLLFSAGIKNISMSLSGILMYINPTLQFLVGILLYNEKLTTVNIITFIFVWVALLLFIISNKTSAKASN